MKLIIFLAFLIEFVIAASRNLTFSEPYIAHTYNTHLKNWTDGDPLMPGEPYLQGYFYIEGTNETDPENGGRIMPDWSENNLLRVCM